MHYIYVTFLQLIDVEYFQKRICLNRKSDSWPTTSYFVQLFPPNVIVNYCKTRVVHAYNVSLRLAGTRAGLLMQQNKFSSHNSNKLISSLSSNYSNTHLVLYFAHTTEHFGVIFSCISSLFRLRFYMSTTVKILSHGFTLITSFIDVAWPQNLDG